MSTNYRHIEKNTGSLNEVTYFYPSRGKMSPFVSLISDLEGLKAKIPLLSVFVLHRTKCFGGPIPYGRTAMFIKMSGHYVWL